MRPQYFRMALLATAISLTMARPAQACMVLSRLDLNDILLAEIVVIADLANYRTTRNEEYRRRELAVPNLDPKRRALLLDPDYRFISDGALFDIQVKRRLVGRVPNKITVTYDGGTFGEPATIAPGRYLIGLWFFQPKNKGGKPIYGVASGRQCGSGKLMFRADSEVAKQAEDLLREAGRMSLRRAPDDPALNPRRTDPRPAGTAAPPPPRPRHRSR